MEPNITPVPKQGQPAGEPDQPIEQPSGDKGQAARDSKSDISEPGPAGRSTSGVRYTSGIDDMRHAHNVEPKNRLTENDDIDEPGEAGPAPVST